MSRSRHPRIATLLLGLLPVACGGSDGTGGSPGSGTASDRSGGASDPSAITTLGTIHATVDGEPRTWYVVTGTIADRPYQSGGWLVNLSGEHQIAGRGFDTPTPPLHTFEVAGRVPVPVGYGEYDGSVIFLVVGTPMGDPPAILRYPHRGTIDVGMFYQPVASFTDPGDGTFHLEEGHLEMTDFAIVDGVGRTSGTFAGTFRSRGQGGTVEITDGRFDLPEVPRAEW